MCGNMYTASVNGCLCSLIKTKPSTKRVGVFKYGGGLASSLFGFTIRGDATYLRKKLGLDHKLISRRKVSPKTYEEVFFLPSLAILASYTTLRLVLDDEMHMLCTAPQLAVLTCSPLELTTLTMWIADITDITLCAWVVKLFLSSD